MITGIGGVGGYIASVLCANYDDVTLIARRKRKESLQTKGLVVHSDFFGDHTAHPAVTDDPASAGIQDVIFVCVKNYSLEAALTAVLPCIGDDTIVVPVLNGFTYHDTAAALMKRGKSSIRPSTSRHLIKKTTPSARKGALPVFTSARTTPMRRRKSTASSTIQA